MEKLLGITIPPRAAYIRMILAELQRLASHLVWLATHAVDIGAITPFFYTFRERDAILDLFEEYCGARLTLNCMKIGGVPFELPDGWAKRCSDFVDAFPAHIAESMTDYKLCDVHRWTVMHGFANDDATRETLNAERRRRGLEPCVSEG